MLKYGIIINLNKAQMCVFTFSEFALFLIFFSHLDKCIHLYSFHVTIKCHVFLSKYMKPFFCHCILSPWFSFRVQFEINHMYMQGHFMWSDNLLSEQGCPTGQCVFNSRSNAFVIYPSSIDNLPPLE